jgi:hypothetical protein
MMPCGFTREADAVAIVDEHRVGQHGERSPQARAIASPSGWPTLAQSAPKMQWFSTVIENSQTDPISEAQTVLLRTVFVEVTS